MFVSVHKVRLARRTLHELPSFFSNANFRQPTGPDSWQDNLGCNLYHKPLARQQPNGQSWVNSRCAEAYLQLHYEVLDVGATLEVVKNKKHAHFTEHVLIPVLSYSVVRPWSRLQDTCHDT